MSTEQNAALGTHVDSRPLKNSNTAQLVRSEAARNEEIFADNAKKARVITKGPLFEACVAANEIARDWDLENHCILMSAALVDVLHLLDFPDAEMLRVTAGFFPLEGLAVVLGSDGDGRRRPQPTRLRLVAGLDVGDHLQADHGSAFDREATAKKITAGEQALTELHRNTDHDGRHWFQVIEGFRALRDLAVVNGGDTNMKSAAYKSAMAVLLKEHTGLCGHQPANPIFDASAHGPSHRGRGLVLRVAERRPTTLATP